MNQWWRGGVIYQVYPRSFQDSNGDGVGDLAGVIDHLDYIAGLGVDCIWLSPFAKSPQHDMGYDVSDYTAVDPLFGTMADFDTLVAGAHARGLKLIIDQVVSHTSDQHPWFHESAVSRHNAKADWYVWADALPDGSPPNNWLSVFGGSAWEWHTARRQYYLHNFLIGQPDLNYHNPEVQEAILDVMRFWLDRGVDGFRLDTVNYYFQDARLRSNPPRKRPAGAALAVNPYDMQSQKYSKSQPENLAWLKRVRALLDQYPGTAAVGEVGDDERGVELMAAYTSGSDMLQMCYSFDFLGPQFSATHFRSKLEAMFRAGPDGWPCWSFSNHDVIRHLTRWAPFSLSRLDLARQMVTLLLTLRGSACLYQGEELGLTEADLAFEDLQDPYGIRFWPEFKGRDGCRTPMVWESHQPNAGFSGGKPWLPVPAEHITLAVNTQEGAAASMLEHYRRMLAFRAAHPALVKGAIRFLAAEGDVVAFERELGGERLLCAFNLGAGEASLSLPQGLRAVAVPGHGLDGRSEDGAIRLGPYAGWFGRLA